MKRSQIRDICKERLGRWVAHLTNEHATPAVVVGFGHDHAFGKLVLCCCEEMDDSVLLAFLRTAVARLEGKDGAQ